MKNLFLGLLVATVVLLASCQQTPRTVVYQQAPVQAVQPVQTQVYQDPNQFYNDPQYLNQAPVQQYVNGSPVLVDAALMAYLTYYHYSLNDYYRYYPTITHIHVYRNGGYVGYSRGYHGYVTSTNYHYVAPNPKYVPVRKDGSPDRRFNVNKTAPASTPNRTFNMTKTNPAPTATPTRTFNMTKSTPSATPQRSFNMSKSSSSSSHRSFSMSKSGRH